MTITMDGQLEFNGIVLGDDVDTFTDEFNGWDDLPPVVSSNAPIAMYHGSYAGRKYAAERVVTWSGVLQPLDTSTFATKLAAIRAATTIAESAEEQQLIIRTVDETLMAYGHVTARAIPGTRKYGASKLANISLQFTCSDPRKYSEEIRTLTIAFPDTTSTGLTYPLTYPLSYGTVTSTGAGTFNNAGDAPLPTIYTVYGPCSNPVITNSTTGNFVSFTIELAAGEYMVINTKLGTVILNGTSDRLTTRSPYSSPLLDMELKQGANLVRVSGSAWSIGANMTISAQEAAYF